MSRYSDLIAKLAIDDVGLRLDLDHPADRSILSECGLDESEVFELLSLHDRIMGLIDGREDTTKTDAPGIA